jgi:hypothetical protein
VFFAPFLSTLLPVLARLGFLPFADGASNQKRTDGDDDGAEHGTSRDGWEPEG